MRCKKSKIKRCKKYGHHYEPVFSDKETYLQGPEYICARCGSVYLHLTKHINCRCVNVITREENDIGTVVKSKIGDEKAEIFLFRPFNGIKSFTCYQIKDDVIFNAIDYGGIQHSLTVKIPKDKTERETAELLGENISYNIFNNKGRKS